MKLEDLHDTVDGSEIRCSPIDIVNISPLFTRLYNFSHLKWLVTFGISGCHQHYQTPPTWKAQHLPKRLSEVDTLRQACNDALTAGSTRDHGRLYPHNVGKRSRKKQNLWKGDHVNSLTQPSPTKRIKKVTNSQNCQGSLFLVKV